jgi:tRNA(fMet)-specific endonuclease VapC
MNGDYLLDTNAVIALLADEELAPERLKAADEVLVPSVVMGELYYGAYNSNRSEANLARVDEFAVDATILGCDIETARRYGEIKDRLRKKGRPIPANDLWVAAVAIQYDLTLITRDAHFAEVDGLKTEAW